MAKNLPTKQEMQVRSLGQEDPLEKGMATHSSILAWRIPGTGEPGGLPSLGSHPLGNLPLCCTQYKRCGSRWNGWLCMQRQCRQPDTVSRCLSQATTLPLNYWPSHSMLHLIYLPIVPRRPGISSNPPRKNWFLSSHARQVVPGQQVGSLLQGFPFSRTL